MKKCFAYLLSIFLLINATRISAQTETIQLVKDIHNTDENYPHGFTAFGDKLLFMASDSAYGYEPWITDGTEAGTFMIKDINPGENDGLSTFFIYVNEYGTDYFLPLPDGKMIFPADDGLHGSEMWITDGTEAGTHLIKDINPGPISSNIYRIFVFNDRIYFGALDASNNQRMWVTDGTETGTFQFMDISLLNDDYAIVNGKLYFAADSIGHGAEPWVTDGTQEGTHMVMDIKPGILPSFPDHFAKFGDKVLFTADSAIYGKEPWITDGTSEGTHLLKDIYPGGSPGNPHTSYPRYYFEFEGRAYFSAQLNYVTGFELWVTDGTESGTYEFKTLNPATTGFPHGDPSQFIAYNSELWFYGHSDAGSVDAIWKSDGTEEGTVNFIDGGQGVFHIFNNKLYYISNNWISQTDGSNSGVEVNIQAGNAVPTCYLMNYCNDKLFVAAKVRSDVGIELYVITNPTAIIPFPENDLFIYPNPATDRIYLNEIKTTGKDLLLTVTDITGRTVISEIIPAGKESVSIDISQLDSGTYIITTGNSSRKFVKN
jgi:ELWxxDGT repeat protein